MSSKTDSFNKFDTLRLSEKKRLFVCNHSGVQASQTTPAIKHQASSATIWTLGAITAHPKDNEATGLSISKLQQQCRCNNATCEDHSKLCFDFYNSHHTVDHNIILARTAPATLLPAILNC